MPHGRRAWICVAGALAAWIACNSCKPYSAEPKQRPNGVPKAAIWAGGADGGSYVFCDVDSNNDVNHCSVWNDFNGSLIESGSYRLLKEKRAARPQELTFMWADRGGRIGLANNKILSDLDGRHP